MTTRPSAQNLYDATSAKSTTGIWPVTLRLLQSGEGWEVFDVVHLRIRSDHVGLTGEDKDADGLLVSGMRSGCEETEAEQKRDRGKSRPD